MNYWILITPFITALTGWLIHKLIVIRILKDYWPKKQQQLFNNAGHWLASNLSLQELEHKIADPVILEKAMPAIEGHIDTFLNEKLQQEIPMLGMFIGTKTTDKIKEIFINQLKQLFPTLMTQMAGNLKSNFDIEKKISEKISDPSIHKITTAHLAEALKKLPMLGLITGLVCGIIGVIVSVIFH